MWNKIWNPSNRKVLGLNIVSAFGLNLFLEWMERKSFTALYQFMDERTFVFLYNVLIIFMTLSIVFLVKKKYFAYGIITVAWGMIGLVNGVILQSRKTPFTAVDLTIAKSILPVLNNYMSVWQIIGIIVFLTAGIAALIVLFLYCPSAKKSFDFKTNVFLVGLMMAAFAIVTYLGVGRNLLISRFDNLIAGYEDYGVVYGFCVTAMDTGIDRPIDYSKLRVKNLRSKIEKEVEKQKKEAKTPNLIFIQLESFFDVTDVEGIVLSEDPLPNIHQLQKETTSGYLTVPVYGAGTINTEFEMITGMNLNYFGTGEYPYRSILHKKTCESMAYWLKDTGYTSTVLHNNNASFYDRDYVFTNLGFDTFVSSENMSIHEFNDVGWSTDQILKNYIFKIMNSTEKKDYIYTISVQGHGDYPDTEVSHPKITVDGPDWNEKYRNQMTYYTNQTAEMDAFIGDLIEALKEYPEDTVLVAYGDHLPGLNFEGKNLKSGSKYKTPYFIWDNFGYNRSHRKKESENIKAYQLPSKVLKQLGISNGVMNSFHQTMKETKNYHKNMKLLQYDMLYGSDFIREGLPELYPTTLKYCVENVRIQKIRMNSHTAYITGANLTNYSRVYVNGKQIPTEVVGDYLLKIPADSIKDGDEIIVRQVSKTNENVTFNESMPYVVHMDRVEISKYD